MLDSAKRQMDYSTKFASMAVGARMTPLSAHPTYPFTLPYVTRAVAYDSRAQLSVSTSFYVQYTHERIAEKNRKTKNEALAVMLYLH